VTFWTLRFFLLLLILPGLEPFEFPHFIWALFKSTYYAIIGLLFGLAVYSTMRPSGWVAAYTTLVCALLIQFHISSNGALLVQLRDQDVILVTFHVISLVLILALAFRSITLKNFLAFSYIVIGSSLLSLDVTYSPEDHLRQSDVIIQQFGAVLFDVEMRDVHDYALPPGVKSVLASHQTVLAIEKETGNKMIIEAGEGTMRTISWDGISRSLNVMPQKDQLHYPDRAGLSYDNRFIWKNHNGVRRCTYEEKVCYFNSEKELDDWKKKEIHGDWKMTENPDGILASYSTKREWNAVVVRVEKGAVKANHPDHSDQML